MIAKQLNDPTCSAVLDAMLRTLQEDVEIHQMAECQVLSLPVPGRNGRLLEIGCRQLADGNMELSDRGETVKELYLSGVELKGSPRTAFDVLLHEYGAVEEGGQVLIRESPDALGAAVWNFVACLLKLEEISRA